MERIKPWPWQERGVAQVMDLLGRGELSVCVTSPTGMGKGWMIEELALRTLDLGGRAIVLTDRKMLTKQTGDRFTKTGIHFGYASAEHGMDTHHNVTVASLQTLRSRVSRGRMELPHSDVVLVDEAHKTGFDYVVDRYRANNPGVSIVGFTATPVGLKGKYDHLVVAGTKQEGRAHGALVPCNVIGCPEPDMRGVRMNAVGEYVHSGMVKRVMQCTVFADVFECWKKHGSGRPTLLWSPGVPESRWFAQEFQSRGVAAAHIDGKTEAAERERIRQGSLDGSIQLVSSCGVMREGVDWPWISYGILIQVCGAYETFCQIVGRILRSCKGKTNAILQDHSGTWWRHGSPNFDREWTLDDTNKKIAEEHNKPKPEGEGEFEPMCCPKCNGIRASGSICPHCGYEHTRSVRMVRTEKGELVDMEASRKVVNGVSKRSPESSKWLSCLFRCGATGRTFSQAAALFHKETGQWPTKETCSPLPAISSLEWHARIDEVYPKFNRRRQYAK